MRFRIPRLAALSLLAVVVVPLQSARAASPRLDPRAAPVFQEVKLELDADRPDYRGSTRVELRVTEAVESFRFHAEGQELERIELTGAGGAIGLEIERGIEGTVTATPERPLEPGDYELEIDFQNAYNTRAVGLYRMENQGRHYLFTQFMAIDARKAFPCWDEPSYKIPWQLTLRVPVAHLAVTNTPIESVQESEGWKTLVFARTPPMPSYLLAIASGPLETAPIPGLSVPGRIVTVSGQSHLGGIAAAMAPPILEAMEEYFGRPYPYAKLDLIAIPEYWPGAMENPGAITFAAQILLLDSRRASIAQRRGLAVITAHELAHMWFGDLVTMRWWDDLWLNESFATWLGQKITARLYPRFQSGLGQRRSNDSLMAQDARPSTTPVRRTVDSLGDILEDLGLAYGKGETVLGMVEQWLGPEIFRRGVLSYIEKHAWGNAEGADLWRALSEAAERDTEMVLASFLDQPGLPLIEVGSDAGGVLTVTQRRFLNHGVEASQQVWTLPLRLRWSDGERTETRTLLLDGEAARVETGGAVSWVFPDDGAYGYYRWSLPRPMLLDLSERSAELLTAPERIAFLGNAAALLYAGKIGGGDYLRILNAFAGDPEPEVVSAVLTGLGRVELAFVPDGLRDQFAAYVRSTLRPVLERFGRERREGEEETVSVLRSRLMEWLGDQGRDPEIRSFARGLADRYLKDPVSVDPSLAAAALRIAALDGDRELFEAYRKSFESALDPVDRARFLSGLASFTRPELREAALAYTLEGPLRPNELFTIPGGGGESEATRDRSFEWLRANYRNLTSRLPEMFAAFLPFAAGGCSEERLESGRAFFSEPEHIVDGTDANLAKVADQVRDCLNLRRREGERVAAYLGARAAS